MRVWLALALVHIAWAKQCTFIEPAPSRAVQPLCGNGVLDAGERCDDGNNIDGDGCSSWCTSFDRLAKPCTLAGVNAPCPSSARSTYAASPSNTRFCSLSSVDASPLGDYVVLADAGLLYRFDLQVDDTSRSVRALQATLDTRYTQFCSVRVVQSTGEVLAHECASQRLLLISADGTRVLWAVELDFFQPTVAAAMPQQSMLLLDQVVLVGTPASAVECAAIWTVDPISLATRRVQSIPCVAYNARVDGTWRAAYSLEGMQPRQVLSGPCLADMAVTRCYVVSMTRSDLSSATVYVPTDGGMDLAYVVSTDRMLGALGTSITRTNKDGRMSYTGRGNCVMLQDQTTDRVQASLRPPPVTIGTGCPYRLQGWPCVQPLNLAFATEITGAAQLVPGGFSMMDTHDALSSRFEVMESNMTNVSGPLLYQSMLRHAWNNATPVDWVELPVSGDLLYITPTTVGYVSTSGMVLQDPFAPGYCKAHNMQGCASGYYGSVGGTCKPCGQGDGSVAYQVQCAYTVVRAQAPYVQFSYVSSVSLVQEDVDLAICLYKQMQGVQVDCSKTNATSFLSPPQPVTMSDMQHVYDWNSEDTSLLDAMFYSPRQGNLSHPLVATCLRESSFSFLHLWLPCALRYLRTQQQNAGGRRLLQTQDKVVEGLRSTQPTTISDTPISYTNSMYVYVAPPPTSRREDASTGGTQSLQALEIGLIAGSSLLVLMLLGVWLCYSSSSYR